MYCPIGYICNCYPLKYIIYNRIILKGLEFKLVIHENTFERRISDGMG